MNSTYPPQEHFVFHLTDENRDNIHEFTSRYSFYPYKDGIALENFINTSFGLIKYLHRDLISALLSFRRSGNKDGVMIIRGFPINDEDLGPTPEHWSKARETKKNYTTEMQLMAISLLLGDVFAFSTQHAGSIVQNVLPVKSDAYEQVGTGSKVFLEWHTEDAFHKLRPDFLGLLCLRGDQSAATTFASVRNMYIPDEYKACLFECRYQAGIDKAHGGSGRAEDGPRISIFSGRYDDPQIRIDTSCIRALPGDMQAYTALEYFIEQMSTVARRFVLQPGDLLLIDNGFAVHGRTEFQPRFDGTDRWLQRVIIASDFRKSSLARTHDFRIVQPSPDLIG